MALNEKSKPRLKTTVYSMQLPDGRLLILFTPEEQIILPKLSALQKELLILADGNLTVAEITAALNEKGIGCSATEVLDQLNFFDERYLLEESDDSPNGVRFPDAYMEKFKRQLSFLGVWSREGPREARAFQEKLHSAHVVLLGAGGFGSDIFYCLIAMGVGHITVVDFDKVELSNLNRQSMYSEEDVGKFKVDVLEEKTKLVETSQISFINRKIDSTDVIVEMIDGADIGVIAADTPREKIFHWMNQACYQTNTPGLFTSGAAPVSIIIGPLVVPGKTPCYSCSMPDIPFSYDDPLVRLINGRLELGVIAPYVRVASGLLSLELLKHITNFAPCRLYGKPLKMNLLNYTTQFYKTVPRSNCPFCNDTINNHQGESR